MNWFRSLGLAGSEAIIANVREGGSAESLKKKIRCPFCRSKLRAEQDGGFDIRMEVK